MAQATDDPSENHETRKLTAREITHLADRIFSRAVSVLSDLRTEVRSDMLIASAPIRLVASEHPDGVTVDVWRA